MNVFKSIVAFLEKTKKSKAPEGFCPNCWGRQEYEGQFFEAVKNQNIDINTISENKGWVLDYAERHLSAIHLKRDDDKLVCSKCKLSYSIAE